MKSTYSVTATQSQLPKLLKEVQLEPIAITRHDETVAYLISKDRMEGILETMEILTNPEALQTLQLAKAGKLKYHSLDSLD